ncbi:MAG: hypothetical protein GYA14_11780 [Ignavibacteria bacterium]|nr:hypothetical protein [Ignavibacteria bacterium]
MEEDIGRTHKQQTEKQLEIKKQVGDMVSRGLQPKEIIKSFQKEIDKNEISQRTIYKYITDASTIYLTTKIIETLKENNSPENIFIINFIQKWTKTFQKETDDIFGSARKRKVLELAPYINQLERIYRLIKEITPQKTTEREITQNVPIIMPREEQ